jgi:hypothetical protein
VRVFVSSSWRNERQPSVVAALKEAGHEVYDFRNPSPGESVPGFSWAEVDDGWQDWTVSQFKAALAHPRTAQGFRYDMEALEACDALVMVQPCGRSAALELGWAAGAGKQTIVLLSDGEPELMLLMAQHFCLTVEEVIAILSTSPPATAP